MSEQLNKLQIKAEILTVLSKLQKMPDADVAETYMFLLDEQDDKKSILDLLLKELTKSNEQKAIMICYMLLRLIDKEPLEEALWTVLKTPSVSDFTKSIVINLLRDMGNKVEYDKLNEFLESPDEIIDADTKKLLHVAIVNPEAQIDFLDFLSALSDADRLVLLQSLGEDYTEDALANILIPVFLHDMHSEVGKSALNILGTTRSQLALHALLEAKDYADDEVQSLIKKSISSLKLAGVREDNALEFYASILSNSHPYECYTSFPDGHGNQALIFSREKENDMVQIVATVVNDKWGVVDCFGFNDVSKTEFSRIVDRFYSGDEKVYIKPNVLKTLLKGAEKLTLQKEGKIPYEFICWRTLFADVSLEPVPAEFILEPLFKKASFSDKELNEIYLMDIAQRWFVDVDYSKEFSEFTSVLNKNLNKNFDTQIDENIDKIFTKSEKTLWNKRFLNSAYLKYLASENIDAQLLYALYFDENAKTKVLKNILRKSIYEYYVSLKFKLQEHDKTTNIFMLKNKPKSHELNAEQVDEVIAMIEGKWVTDV